MVPAARVKLTSWWCFACYRGQETKYVCLAIVPKSIQTRRTLPAVNGFELLAASRFGAKKCAQYGLRGGQHEINQTASCFDLFVLS